jgi:hypothetical protein
MTRATFTIAAVAFVRQRRSQLAAGDAISSRHAYIKNRKANIKHFLAEGLMRCGVRSQSRVKTSCLAILAEI